MHLVKILALVIATLLGFVGGWALTLVVLTHAMAPSSGCASPCDAPAYVAMGLSIFAGPVMGVLTGGVSAMLVAPLFRRNAAH